MWGEPAIKLLGEAEGEGGVEAGAEGEDLVGEQLLGGALPPALLPPRRDGLEAEKAGRIAHSQVPRRRRRWEVRRKEIEVVFFYGRAAAVGLVWAGARRIG